MLTGGTIHTGTGEVIENGIITFSDGKITMVGKASEVKIDKSGYEVMDDTLMSLNICPTCGQEICKHKVV
jgi:imidazolonepropionase-like amidohydrolase